jgi:hypothetical protein
MNLEPIKFELEDLKKLGPFAVVLNQDALLNALNDLAEKKFAPKKDVFSKQYSINTVGSTSDKIVDWSDADGRSTLSDAVISTIQLLKVSSKAVQIVDNDTGKELVKIDEFDAAKLHEMFEYQRVAKETGINLLKRK